jgi:protein-tyrosine phosphatase
VERVKVWTIISGHLYMRGDMRHIKRTIKLAELARLSVDTVVCLIKKTDPDLQGIEGLEYVNIPLSDSIEVDAVTAYRVCDLVVARLRAGRTVLLHCIVGKNRSGLTSALVVRELRGCSGAHALLLVRFGRPGAVTNRHFEEFLHRLPPPWRWTRD